MAPPPLTAPFLLAAYRQGIFPMAEPDGTIHWYAPDPRAIFDLENFHVPRRLARTVRAGRFEVSVDTDFEAVMRACAEPAPGRELTWISEDFVRAYGELFRQGHAHSVETRLGGLLVGGLYGVAIGGAFMGESMFSRERDASKVALVHLVERLKARGFVLLDTQFMTAHLARFGAVHVPLRTYLRRLEAAVEMDVRFGGGPPDAGGP
jgi:leucyl/phenylalanyl-tRNA---protein transferase